MSRPICYSRSLENFLLGSGGESKRIAAERSFSRRTKLCKLTSMLDCSDRRRIFTINALRVLRCKAGAR